MIRCLLLVCIFLGVWQTGKVALFHAKAFLAEQFIERAWQETLNGRIQARPWPWADTWPVAEMSVPRLGIRQIILSGDSGRVLAFGPGHTEQSAQPGAGITVISAHRDTHFGFLKALQQGDEIILRTPASSVHFQVNEFAIVDAREYRIDTARFEDAMQTGQSNLLLVTCYPFDALRAGGNQRYLVMARSAFNSGSSVGTSSEMMLHNVSLSMPR
jgi:sortase A